MRNEPNPAAIAPTLVHWLNQSQALARMLNSGQIDVATVEIATPPTGSPLTLPELLLLSLLSHHTAMPSALATLETVARLQSELSVTVSRSLNSSDPQKILTCTLTVSCLTTENDLDPWDFDHGAGWNVETPPR